MSLTVLVIVLVSLAFAGYKYGVGPFTTFVLKQASINVVTSDTPEANAAAAAYAMAKITTNKDIINKAAQQAAAATIQQNVQTALQNPSITQDTTVTKIIDHIKNPGTVSTGTIINQQAGDLVLKDPNAQAIIAAAANAGAQSVGKTPPFANLSSTTSAGGMCDTAGSPVQSGKWVATGYGFRGPSGTDTADNTQRECVKCGGGGYETPKQGGQYQSCSDLFKTDPSQVILPPDAGQAYTGIAQLYDAKGNPISQNPCFKTESGITIQASYGDTYGNAETPSYCSINGRWVTHDEFINNLKIVCTGLGQVPTSDNKKCQVPAPVPTKDLPSGTRTNSWTNCKSGFAIADSKSASDPNPYVCADRPETPVTPIKPVVPACVSGIDYFNGVKTTCNNDGTSTTAFCSTGKFNNAGVCIPSANEKYVVNPNGSKDAGEIANLQSDCIYGGKRSGSPDSQYICNGPPTSLAANPPSAAGTSPTQTTLQTCSPNGNTSAGVPSCDTICDHVGGQVPKTVIGNKTYCGSSPSVIAGLKETLPEGAPCGNGLAKVSDSICVSGKCEFKWGYYCSAQPVSAPVVPPPVAVAPTTNLKVAGSSCAYAGFLGPVNSDCASNSCSWHKNAPGDTIKIVVAGYYCDAPNTTSPLGNISTPIGTAKVNDLASRPKDCATGKVAYAGPKNDGNIFQCMPSSFVCPLEDQAKGIYCVSNAAMETCSLNGIYCMDSVSGDPVTKCSIVGSEYDQKGGCISSVPPTPTADQLAQKFNDATCGGKTYLGYTCLQGQDNTFQIYSCTNNLVSNLVTSDGKGECRAITSTDGPTIPAANPTSINDKPAFNITNTSTWDRVNNSSGKHYNGVMCFNDPSSCASSYCTNSYCANPPNDKQSNAAPALNLTSDPGAAALVAQAQLAAAQVSGDGTGGTPPKPPSIDYKNQLNYSDVKVAGGGTLADSGCGVIAGAMVFSLVTGKSDPAAYMALLDKHGGVTSGGTGWFDQIKPIFDENHFTVVPVYGSTADKEKQITQYAKNGTPVWINAYIDNGSGAWIGHHTLAIGVDSSTGDLILDDPYYGKDYHMPISRFDIDCSHSGCPNGTSSWIMNAIIPPPPSPTS